MDQQQYNIINDLRALMAYHHSIGIEEYPGPAMSLPLVERRIKSAGIVSLPSQGQALAAGSERPEDIATEVNSCRNCELAAQRVMPVPGRGTARARLLIVGGWLTTPELTGSSSDLIFGLEEDRMMARMLEAIHLDPADVFVTNILKCGLPASCQPAANHVHCCLSYLQRQIVAIAPVLLCSMGIIATRALLDMPQSLSQLRGRCHLYTALDGRKIPLIPTYHPSYLLQATEMKAETWKDLQLIEQKLAGKEQDTL